MALPEILQQTTVLVPLRADGKLRLASSLDADSRWRLAVAMLDGVLDAISGAGVLDVRILADGEAALEVARARGVDVVPDRRIASIRHAAEGDGEAEQQRTGAQELRQAVDAGLAGCDQGRIRAVIAADLPLLVADDVRALLTTADRVTVAPTRDGGTGALLLPAGQVIETRYGRGSAASHLEAARAQDLEVVRLERSGFAVDLDTAVDLEAIIAIARMGGAPGGARCSHHLVAALTELRLLGSNACSDRASA
jgi:2-phospho-L-lactate guanylyltransferase